MFPDRYFAGTYYTPRYFAKFGAAVITGVLRTLSLLGIGR